MPRVSVVVLSLSTLVCATSALAKDIILNEWNCVGSQKWLGNPGSPNAGCPMPDGPAGVNCSNNDDSFFGRVMGNGGDWIELVIIKDNMDLRGWKIQWVEWLETDADGVTDIWVGIPSVPQGEIIFTNDPKWSNLRKGTILTITERGTAAGGLDTDFSFDPCNGDWWINACADDTQYIICNANVCDAGPPLDCTDPFDVGNGDWQARILDAQGNIHVGLVGEGAPGWSGSGVNSREVVKLRQDPSTAINEFSDYRGGDSSTFGGPNSWTNPANQCRTYQNFTALRASVYADLCSGCNLIWLNEYNAVKSDNFLNGGNSSQDSQNGFASDSFFGRVQGNGGDWFELVVSINNLDLRNWSFRWQEVEGGKEGEIFLTNHPFWSNLPAGRILTFIERTSAQGGLDTNLNAGPNWSNINTFDTALIAGTTGSAPGHVSGRFTTSNDKWRIEIRNAIGEVVVPWAGEGSPHYYRGGVSSTEVCRLRENATSTIDASSAYDDSAASSTFGAPNTWLNCPSPALVTQSFATLLSTACTFVPPCGAGDVNCDGIVNGADIAIVLGSWGPCVGCAADLNGDGVVNGADIAIVLGNWG
ncbi:MAG: dockerin type I repeat-containing protein [Phycisphaeraceae bacterium]|nr:dockerin type I repeat-containing protein [Phycisphaeraceae bacterium]